MGWVESEPVSAPALKKIAAVPDVSSLSEALSSFTSVVITDGSSGIGKSFIELCAKLNPTLVVCNLSRHAPVINNGKLKLRHFPCDLAECVEISRIAADLETFLADAAPTGRVLLINNAGVGAFGSFPEPDLAQSLVMIDVNIRSLVELTGRMLPLLKKRGGVIMNIASTAAFQPTPFTATYGATKAFVLHWSLALNVELRGSGVSTLAVCPGTTSTDFFDRAGVAPRASSNQQQTSEEVAWTAIQALQRGEPQVVSGWINRVMVAVVTKLPKPLAARLAGRVLKDYYQKRDRA